MRLDHEKLKALRTQKGWTQGQVLGRLAINYGYYCNPAILARYEGGKIKRGSANLVILLAKLYGVQPEELLESAQ